MPHFLRLFASFALALCLSHGASAQVQGFQPLPGDLLPPVDDLQPPDLGEAPDPLPQVDVEQRPGGLLDPPPYGSGKQIIERVSACPKVGDEPRCVYVVQHERHGTPQPFTGQLASRLESALNVMARNFSLLPANIDMAWLTMDGVPAASANARLLPGEAGRIERATGNSGQALVIVSDTKLLLDANVELGEVDNYTPPDRFPGLDFGQPIPPPMAHFDTIATRSVEVQEVDCSKPHGRELLCMFVWTGL